MESGASKLSVSVATGTDPPPTRDDTVINTTGRISDGNTISTLASKRGRDVPLKTANLLMRAATTGNE